MLSWRSWLLLAVLALLFGCSQESSSPEAAVEVSAQLVSPVVSARSVQPGISPLGRSTVDSLSIERVRILLTRLKLHAAGEDTAAGGRDLKVGPFVASFTPQQQILAGATIPPGTYRWLKMEFHRFSDSEAARYATDSLFRDFVVPERASVLIEGKVFVGDSVVPFVYRSDITANVSLLLDPPASVGESDLLRLLVQFDPQQVFVEGAVVLDPRDQRLESLIDNKLRSALKALKRAP
jgi:hypothetical protein